MGISYFLPVRLSTIVSVSAMRALQSERTGYSSPDASGSPGGLSAWSGTRYSSLSQRPRSTSLHRSLQNGRHFGSTGRVRQYTQSDSDRVKPTYSINLREVGLGWGSVGPLAL